MKPDQLTKPPTPEQRAENYRALSKLTRHERFMLMFGRRFPELTQPRSS